jgi:hypothetical protein
MSSGNHESTSTGRHHYERSRGDTRQEEFDPLRQRNMMDAVTQSMQYLDVNSGIPDYRRLAQDYPQAVPLRDHFAERPDSPDLSLEEAQALYAQGLPVLQGPPRSGNRPGKIHNVSWNGRSVREFSTKYELDQSSVSKVITGRLNTTKGYNRPEGVGRLAPQTREQIHAHAAIAMNTPGADGLTPAQRGLRTINTPGADGLTPAQRGRQRAAENRQRAREQREQQD